MLYGIHWRNSHLCRFATSLLHEPFKSGEFLIAYLTQLNFIDEIAGLLSRHRNCVLQLLQLGLQTSTEFLRRWWKQMSMKPIIFTIHNSIEAIYPPEGHSLFECKEVSHLLETMSIHSLSHYRQHLSTLLLFLRFEEYSFSIISVRNVILLTLAGGASRPSWRRFHSCIRRPQRRSRHSSSSSSDDASLLGGILSYSA